MKKVLLFSIFGIWNLFFGICSAQAPQAFKYQTIARDAQGDPISDKPVNLRISILEGSSDGIVIYCEKHQVMTNSFGLINIEIGRGKPEGTRTANLSSIKWDENSYFVKIELDAKGGTNYIPMGTSELLSVPYALFAESSGDGSNRSGEWNHSGTDKVYLEAPYSAANVGIGTTIPIGMLNVHGVGFNTPILPALNIEHEVGYSSTFRRVVNNPGNALFLLQKARGTLTAPMAVQTDDNVGMIRMEAFDGTSYCEAGWLRVRVDGVVTTGIVPGAMLFATADATGTINEQMRISSAGNVGIGTTMPFGKLNVKDGAVIFEGTSGSAPAIGTGTRLMWIPAKHAFRVGAANSDQWDNANIGSYSMGLGQGALASGFASVSIGDMNEASGSYSVSIGSDNEVTKQYALALGHDNNVYGEYSVAIGTDNNTDTFAVAIGTYANAYEKYSFAMGTNVGATAKRAFVLGTGGDSRYSLDNNIENSLVVGFNATTILFVGGPSESVGIGTTAPSEKLQVQNTASGGGSFIKIWASHATNFGEAGIRIETPQNRWHLRMDDDANNNIPDGALGLRSQDGATEVMTWNENGNVGIGIASPTLKLSVNGNANKASGGTSWATWSDVRMKTNVKPIYNALDKITSLRGVTFEWIDKENFDENIHMGVIAQEVEQVIPEWIITTDNGYKMFQPEGFEGIIVEAIKQLKAENDSLKNEIEQLKIMIHNK